MHFYRPLAPISAMTFDLDNTLFNNCEVIQCTQMELVRFLQAFHPTLSAVRLVDLQRIRETLCEQEPEICHDITEWRCRTVEQLLLEMGLDAASSSSGAEQVMMHFAYWRSQITLSPETHDTLHALSQRWPLAAITNGNADLSRFGLERYFQFIFRAGPDSRAKPFGDMYYRAAQELSVATRQILHVGDDLTTDVAGAVRNDLQACWVNLYKGNFMHINDARLLPHVEISRLALLTMLL
ncbi:MAG: 5-amino-6-(5-phospho-D-ribitylamino)uracil phosphatase YigB [Candidatus Malihini olakiniferum]